jgi:hypothetical protein
MRAFSGKFEDLDLGGNEMRKLHDSLIEARLLLIGLYCSIVQPSTERPPGGAGIRDGPSETSPKVINFRIL